MYRRDWILAGGDASAGAGQLVDGCSATIATSADFSGRSIGALIGAFVVWITRILGTLGFGRVAMGLGDVHLMFGVGAIIGAGASDSRLFPRAVLRHHRGRVYAPHPHTPRAAVRALSQYGGWLVMLFYCPIAEYLTPGLEGLGVAIRSVIGSVIGGSSSWTTSG